MGRATPPPRRSHAGRHGRRRAQPSSLLWIIVAFAALVGAKQIAAFQHDLVAPPSPPAADARQLSVETTHLDGSEDDAAPDNASGALKELASAGRFTGASDGSSGAGELRWVAPEAIPFVSDPVLAAQVSQRIAGRSGRYGIAIKDLRTGRGVLVDPDGRYEAASLFKLSVMYEVFTQREAGILSFSEPLILTQRHVDYDLGTLDRPAGSSIGLGEALERMITISDNSSAILLTDRVGAGNINRDVERLGMTRTHLSSEDLSTSPRDMLTFFETLARGDSVSREASADMLYLLARQRVNDRIPRLLPAGSIVAHKTGNLPGVVNDAGIVYAGDQVFVIAVLVDGTTQDGEAARIASELAALALDYFQGNAQRGDALARPLGDVIPIPEPWPTPRPAPTVAPRPTATPTAEVLELAVPTPVRVRPSATSTLVDELEQLPAPSPPSTSTSTVVPAPEVTIPPPAATAVIERTAPVPERRVPGGAGATATPATIQLGPAARPTNAAAPLTPPRAVSPG